MASGPHGREDLNIGLRLGREGIFPDIIEFVSDPELLNLSLSEAQENARDG